MQNSECRTQRPPGELHLRSALPLASGTSNETLNHPEVRILLKRFLQARIAQPVANALHRGESLQEGVLRLVRTIGLEEELPEREIRLPALHRVPQRRGNVA